MGCSQRHLFLDHRPHPTIVALGQLFFLSVYPLVLPLVFLVNEARCAVGAGRVSGPTLNDADGDERPPQGLNLGPGGRIGNGEATDHPV